MQLVQNSSQTRIFLCNKKFIHYTVIKLTLIFGEHNTKFDFFKGLLQFKNYLVW